MQDILADEKSHFFTMHLWLTITVNLKALTFLILLSPIIKTFSFFSFLQRDLFLFKAGLSKLCEVVLFTRSSVL